MRKQKIWLLLSLFFFLLSPAWAALGEPLPKFNVPTLTGSRLTNKTFLGKVSLLNFWGSWCGYCMHEHPMLMRIKSRYGVPIYSIDLRDSPAEGRRVLRNRGNPFVAVGMDPSGRIADLLNVYGTPETFVIDKKGRIRYKHNGPIDQGSWNNTLWPMIQQLQAEQ